MILLMRSHCPKGMLNVGRKAVTYGLQTMSYKSPKIWDLVPKEMKQVTTLNEFMGKIKISKLGKCSYRLSRTYLPQIIFIA